MKDLITTIVRNAPLHVKWLNTLSYLENCGARKIAAYEHPTLVKQEVLKHAAEEFRHAHYLKSQIGRISSTIPLDYSEENTLGGWTTRRYLDRLELAISRFGKVHGYVLVTYAIEKRAETFYPEYEACLREHASNVRVRSIILEEDEHLEQMEKEISLISGGEELKNQAVAAEEKLFAEWKDRLHFSLSVGHSASFG